MPGIKGTRMRMKRVSIIVALTIISLLVCAFPLTVLNPITASANAVPTIHSSCAKTAPTIDGIFGNSEWADATVIDLQADDPENPVEAYAYFMNDANMLYICVDVPGDTTEDDYSDVTDVAFDTGHDGIKTDGHEDWFFIGRAGSASNHYVWDSSRSGINIHCLFDSSLPLHDGLAGKWGFGPSPNDITPHRIYEFSIPSALIMAYRGDTIGFRMITADVTQYTVYHWPGLAYWQSTGEDYGDLVLDLCGLIVGGTITEEHWSEILIPWLALAGVILVGSVLFVRRKTKA
ncbi:hypothetical protein ACFLXT_01890 [Chloroflexota bacterium]